MCFASAHPTTPVRRMRKGRAPAVVFEVNVETVP
jgi:hypothetical protein